MIACLRSLAWIAAVLAAIGLSGHVEAQEPSGRLALVIGNSAYQHAPPLANPKSDAALMAETLKGAGFEVVMLIDADQPAMKRALLDFGRQLRTRKTEAGLFYYAGHGVQVKGENYLIPVTARIEDEDEVELEGVNVNDFLSVMNSSQSAVNIVVLDACRNNPFKSASRSASRGLAAVEAPTGTYIAYATAPGQVALDGEGGNSPYTRALTAAMKEPGRPLESVFKSARSGVLAATGRQQTPWETSSITGDFYFHAPAGAAALAPASGQTSPVTDAVSEPRTARLEPTPAPAPQSPPPPRAGVCTREGEARFGGRVCVTSVLASQFGNAYGPRNLVDGVPSTAWSEGARWHGVGEMVVIVFPEPRPVSSLSLINGYAKNDDIFFKNGRVRSMTISSSAGETAKVQLRDARDWQSFSLPFRQPATWISLEIANVYAGARYQDTAISEIDVK